MGEGGLESDRIHGNKLKLIIIEANNRVEYTPKELCKLMRKKRIKPCIARITRNRIEILTLPKKAEKAATILAEIGLTPRIRATKEPETATLNDIIELLMEERFYEAHIASEKLMEENHRLGLVLALYSALLVKKAEDSPRATQYLFNLLREYCGKNCDFINLDCVGKILTSSSPIDGGGTIGCLGSFSYS